MAEDSEKEAILPLWDHIAELSKRIKIWLYSLVIATFFFLAFPADPVSVFRNPLQLYRPLIAAILLAIRTYLLPPQYTLIGGTVTTPLEVILVGAVVFGFAASVPVLAYEIYKFVDPAIKPGERGSIYPFVGAFSVLFLAGAFFGFFVLLPFVFYFSLFFFSIVGIATFIYANDFYNLIFFVMAASGLAFTIPVFLVLLVKLHVMSTKPLVKNRKYVWAATLILTAIASPDGGPLADVALFVPMIILIEGAIRYARRYEKETPLGMTAPSIPSVCAYCGGPLETNRAFCRLCGKAAL